MERRILEEADPESLVRVIAKSIAVSSGKGGVGKTITACNLAIHYARKGLRVGLVDLDPLSDVASLLDLHESEDVLRENGPADASGTASGNGRGKALGLKQYLLPVFQRLEILFPYQKLASAEVGGLMEKIYLHHLREIDDRYDLLLFDMPAGMNREENLAYLPFMRRLVLVTNPQPTAHASAGAYAKEVLRLHPGREILLWHNRFTSRVQEGFRPSDVAGNYNRFVDPEERLTPVECAQLREAAFVPEDPVLDLLAGEPDPSLHVVKCMRDGLERVHGRLLAQAARGLPIPRRVQDLVASYVQRHPRIGDPEAYLAHLGGYLDGVLAAAEPGRISASGDRLFTDAEREMLKEFLRRIGGSALRRQILLVEELLAEHVRGKEQSRGAFGARPPADADKTLEREVGRILVMWNRSAAANALLKSHGSLLLFQFALYKMFQSKTVAATCRLLVPRRKNSQGRMVRDRFRQIRILVERDDGFRARYVKVIRLLHTVLMRQITAVADAFSLPALVLRVPDGKMDGKAYLRLLSTFLHETLYSGLSVIVGFEYRSAAAAFQEGADRLLESLEDRKAGG